MPIEPIMSVRKVKQDFRKRSGSENEYEAIKTINNNIYKKKQNVSLKNVARKVMKKSAGSIDLLGDPQQKSNFQTKENDAYLVSVGYFNLNIANSNIVIIQYFLKCWSFVHSANVSNNHRLCCCFVVILKTEEPFAKCL